MLQSASLSIVPVLQSRTERATGYLDLGAPSNYDLQLDDDDYKSDLIEYEGNELSDLSTSGSTLSGYTFKPLHAPAFGLPKGFELIRIRIERIPGSASPDNAHPIIIVLTGPGVPEFAAEVIAPQEFVFLQPIGSMPDLDGASTHIAATVPVANQGILKLFIQLKVWKPA